MGRRAIVILLAVTLAFAAGLLARPVAEAGQAAPSGPAPYIFPRIPPPADGELIPCLPDNPSCGRDDWYAEWDESQSTRLVQFTFVGPGLVTERRFAEAVRLLWQAPGGRELLEGAAERGVVIRDGAFGGRKYPLGMYDSRDRAVWINSRYTGAATWMLAADLGHELRHAIDPRTEPDYPVTFEECLDREVVAFEFEHRFVGWIAARFGGLPGIDQMQTLSKDDVRLYRDLARKSASDDVPALVRPRYEERCSAVAPASEHAHE